VLIRSAISLAPVFAFLVSLIILDSYKLVRLSTVLKGVLAGCVAASACMVVNRWMLGSVMVDPTLYSRYVAPLIEEVLKAVYLIYLIRRGRIGFTVDAAIIGFAAGSGFSLAENVYYLSAVDDTNLLLWIVRGFGTAVMHGSTTAIVGIVSRSISDRRGSLSPYVFVPGLVSAIVIHSAFNHFLLNPVITTIGQLLALPLITAVVFKRSEYSLRKWLEEGMAIDVGLLEHIESGRAAETKAGAYLQSLKSTFPGEIVADMLCLLRIHLELQIRAKGVLLAREVGFDISGDPQIEDRLRELRFLERSIGKTGRLAMSPILHRSSRDLWQLYLIKKK
jgi:RsiW-degrading membrane proteinase PrsW (M82 family)